MMVLSPGRGEASLWELCIGTLPEGRGSRSLQVEGEDVGYKWGLLSSSRHRPLTDPRLSQKPLNPSFEYSSLAPNRGSHTYPSFPDPAVEHQDDCLPASSCLPGVSPASLLLLKDPEDHFLEAERLLCF